MITTKVKEKSFFVYLYRYIFRTKAPQGLCKLVWGSLLALILFIPATLFWLPPIIGEVIAQIYWFLKGDVKKIDFDYLFEDWLDFESDALWAVCFFLWICIFIVIVTIKGTLAWFGVVEYNATNNGVAIFIYALTVIILGARLYNTYIAGREFEKRKKKELYNAKVALEKNNVDYSTWTDDYIRAVYLIDYKPDSNWKLLLKGLKALRDKACPKIEYI